MTKDTNKAPCKAEPVDDFSKARKKVWEGFDQLSKAMGGPGKTLLEFEIERRKAAKRKGCIITVIVLILGIVMGYLARHCAQEEPEEQPEPVASTVEEEQVIEEELFGAFGIVEDNVIYKTARAPAINPSDIYICRVTVYGPPDFPDTNETARCIEGEGCITVREAINWAHDLGLDGICAASPGTPWYDRVRDPMPPIIQIEGIGILLCVDRMADWIVGGMDVYVYDPYPGGTYFAEKYNVWELDYEEPE